MRVGRGEGEGAQSRWVPLVVCVRSTRAALLWKRHSKEAFLSPWTGRDFEGGRCVERNNRKEGRRRSEV